MERCWNRIAGRRGHAATQFGIMSSALLYIYIFFIYFIQSPQSIISDFCLLYLFAFAWIRINFKGQGPTISHSLWCREIQAWLMNISLRSEKKMGRCYDFVIPTKIGPCSELTQTFGHYSVINIFNTSNSIYWAYTKSALLIMLLGGVHTQPNPLLLVSSAGWQPRLLRGHEELHRSIATRTSTLKRTLRGIFCTRTVGGVCFGPQHLLCWRENQSLFLPI